jgi:hypothetical protein
MSSRSILLLPFRPHLGLPIKTCTMGLKNILILTVRFRFMACIAPEIHGMKGIRALSPQSVILGLKKVENVVQYMSGVAN